MRSSNMPGYTLVYFLAVGFGSGLLPKAPGTWGTLAAIPGYLLVMMFLPQYLVPITVIMTLLGVGICHWVCVRVQRDDPSEVVWDEICGFFITMCFLPHSSLFILLGFCAFRIFDIWKPQPIRWVETLSFAGLAVMLDDVVAALYAALSVHGVWWLLQRV